MSANKYALNTHITTTGEISPSQNGGDIANLNQLRVVIEDAGNSNTIDIRVRIAGQSTFTTLTTVTGSVNTVIDIETYDQIKLFCTSYETSAVRVKVVVAGFKTQKSGAFEYPTFGDFPNATGSGNFAWDTANSNMYYDEPSSKTWVQISGVGGGSGNYFPEAVRAITAGELAAKQITLAGTPTDANKTRLFIQGGPTQVYGDDFTVSGNVLTWNGLGLDGIIEENDKIFITYN